MAGDIRSYECKLGLLDLIRQFRFYSNLTLVEIGVWKGESTELFHRSGIFAKHYCVDPWKAYKDDVINISQNDMDDVKNDFFNYFRYAYNVYPIQGTIDTFIELYKDIPVDVVYIDANHEYEFVKYDIQKTLDVIKPKMAICGHDYDDPNIPGVKKAVDEIFGKKPDMTFIDTSWLYWLDINKSEI